MWRISTISGTLEARVKRQQFEYTREMERLRGQGPGNWPDADMLALGKLKVTDKEGGGTPTKFTLDEQQTVMTLWSIFRSPLIFGGDLPSNDDATTALITNQEVIDVDQHSTGGHQSLDRGNIRVWIADGAQSGDRYVAVFNIGDSPEKADLLWDDIGLEMQAADVRDLWTTGGSGKGRWHSHPAAAARERVVPRPWRLALLKTFDQVKVGKHAVIAEDAGVGVGSHEDGTDIFNARRIGGR